MDGKKSVFNGIEVVFLGYTLLTTPEEKPCKTDKLPPDPLLRIHQETDYIETDKPLLEYYI